MCISRVKTIKIILNELKFMWSDTCFAYAFRLSLIYVVTIDLLATVCKFCFRCWQYKCTKDTVSEF